jgi:hypothetical protein
MLRPCPLCGNEHLKILEIINRGFVIPCRCGIEFRTYSTNKAAFIKAWNRRV